MAWELVIAAGLRLRHLLGEEELASWPKLTGGKDLHVMVPLAQKLAHDIAHDYAKTLVQRLAAERPERYVRVADLAKRRGKIFLDYLRNGRGTTAIGTYSPRVRAGFPIAAGCIHDGAAVSTSAPPSVTSMSDARSRSRALLRLAEIVGGGVEPAR